MKILVTGLAGFIGSHVAEAYLRSGHDVIGVDNLSSGQMANVPAGARLYCVDLLQSRRLDRVLGAERPDVVNHHAASADVARISRSPRWGMEVNLLGTLNLLRSCVRHGVRKIIFISSAAVYGDPARLPVDEAQPLSPINVYGVSKAAAELLVRAWAINSGLRYTILRYANVYGPRQATVAEGGVVAAFLDALERGAPPIVAWDGEQTRDFVYVADLAAANVAALERGDGGVYNLGTGVPTSINQLLKAVSKILGIEREPLRTAKRVGDIRASYFDCSAAARDLRWSATTSLEEGLRALVDWRRART